MLPTTVRLAVRNVRRRPVRTGLTAGMVIVGVGILVLALTWIRGVFGTVIEGATGLAGHVRLVDREFAAREELMPLYENLPESAPLVALLERQPGVVAVEPRIATGVTVTAGAEIGDVFAMAVGASERYFRERLGAKDKLVRGTWFSGEPHEIVAGAKVAEQTGAKIGDELLLLGTTQDGALSPIKGKLVGVYRAGGPLDQQLLLPLGELRWLTDITDGATEILVFGDDYARAGVLAAELRAVPELSGYAVQAWLEREPFASMLGTVQVIQNIIAFFFVFLTALGIWNTMMMSVLERTHEIGVLRAMGLSRLGAVGLFVGEALAIGVAGGIGGVLLAAWPAWLLETRGVTLGERIAGQLSFGTETIYGDLSLEVVFSALILGMVMALVGSALPALRAASIQPVSAMRSGR